MRVVHVTLEDLGAGLFRTQVLDIAREIVRRDPSVLIEVHAINRPWLWRRHQELLTQYRRQLSGSGVSIRYTPLLPPLRHALGRASYSRLVTWIMQAALMPFRGRAVDVFHSRSYWPAMALHALGLRNVVFDPRSLWVSENISTGDLVADSASHRYWLAAEADCVKRAAATTVVSAPMGEYFLSEYGVGGAHLVPISFAPATFQYSAEARAQRRTELGWESERVFVYSGSLGMSGVNVSALQSMFASALADANARLLFLTSEPDSAIQTSLATAGDVGSRVRVIRPRASEMGQWLTASDVGLHALPRQLDWRTRLGTKVVEYWACGLPVVVNEHVGAAASYIRTEDAGRVVTAELDANGFKQLADEAVSLDRTRIAQFALRTFATEVVADRYLSVYRAVASAGRQ